MTAMLRGGTTRLALLSAVVTAALTAGCASGNQGGGPTRKALAAGETCGSIKQQLNRLDSKGVPAVIQRQSAGGKISASQKADADLYNRLLNDYLGAQCHA